MVRRIGNRLNFSITHWLSNAYRWPDPPPNPNLACMAFGSLSSYRVLGFIQRFGADGSGQLLSLGAIEHGHVAPEFQIL